LAVKALGMLSIAITSASIGGGGPNFIEGTGFVGEEGNQGEFHGRPFYFIAVGRVFSWEAWGGAGAAYAKRRMSGRGGSGW
jgi:hypothetical protein